jgi:rhodanese-related sulfurtransferase
MSPLKEITPGELKAHLESPAPPVLLDVREHWEWEIAHVAGARLIPMGSVPDRLDELDPARDLVVMCHHGGRSRQIVAFLQQHGYDRVSNLAGGIAAWSRDVDPSVPQY